MTLDPFLIANGGFYTPIRREARYGGATKRNFSCRIAGLPVFYDESPEDS